MRVCINYGQQIQDLTVCITTKDRRHQEMLAARRRIVAAGASVLATCFTAAWFAVIVPIMEDVAMLERRLVDVEKRIAHHVDVSEPK